ncbi:MFS transporter [Actinokineospora sp. NBRC 105648]|uniref:MFS transporter n=1 Tax=Actinokineospora sp. NBRC 105648 TaxID=3032206 RepID=UPI0024A2DC4E|nr:MFS transporter [Actinokineospora sp. NBRC 105648]GLZ40829.1 MFS transporter [Actinokineospora sp. NBRC 105648]
MSTETNPGAPDQADPAVETTAAAEVTEVTEAAEPGTEPAADAGGRWGLALAAIVGAEFMLQLDGTVVNVALPTLQTDLGLDVPTASWVPNGFLLAFGALLLFSGRLGDSIGHRRVFAGGIALVTLASLVAGLAQNVPTLLVGRVLQGAGAALAGPAGLALLATAFSGERQQRAFGLYSTVTGLGAAAGMVLGGVLTSVGDWRWSLLVNVPIGLVILAVAARTLGLRGDSTNSRSLGLPSAALATGSLVLLVFGLVGAAKTGWTSTSALLPLAAGVVLAVVLVLVDRRAADPLLPGRIFADRARAASFVSLVLLAAVLTGFLLYLVQYLQNSLHLSPLKAGLAILPFGLALLAIIQFVTPRLAKVDLKVRGVAGLVLVLAGVAWLSALDASSTYATGVLPQIVLLGFGVGLAIVPINMIILTTSAPEDTGITAGLLQTSLTIGGVLGVAVLLIPFTSGTGVPADTIGGLFGWTVVITAAALLVVVAGWFAPKRAEQA